MRNRRQGSHPRNGGSPHLCASDTPVINGDIPAIHSAMAHGSRRSDVGNDPSRWTAASPSPSYGQTTWSFQGLGGGVQLTASPLASNFFQLLPMVFTPPGTGLHWGPSLYQDQIVLNGSVTKEVLSSSGTLYSIDVDGGPTHRILASWHHPSVATVTEAVHLMEQSPVNQVAPDYRKVFANAADGWILSRRGTGRGPRSLLSFSDRRRRQDLVARTVYVAGELFVPVPVVCLHLR